MNSSDLVTQYSAIFLALASAVAAGITSWNSRRNERERAVEAARIKAEADKLDTDRDKISVEAAQYAVTILRGELEVAKREKKEYNDTIIAQNELIRSHTATIDRLERTNNVQGEQIDHQGREIVALRRWAKTAKTALEKGGIEGVPPVPNAEDDL